MTGRQYDKDGNLRQWWNNGTIKAFRQRAQCIIDQYSNYVLEPLGMHVCVCRLFSLKLKYHHIDLSHIRFRIIAWDMSWT